MNVTAVIVIREGKLFIETIKPRRYIEGLDLPGKAAQFDFAAAKEIGTGSIKSPKQPVQHTHTAPQLRVIGVP